MKLFHVSFDLDEPLRKEFIPRIPSNTTNDENETISRICFSDSIQGCIRAINGYPKIDSSYVDVIVWEHDFQNTDSLYDWKYLYGRNLVPDAAVTHEYWYTKRIVLDGTKYRIANIKYRTFYSFHKKYKRRILRILSDYIDDLSDIKSIDPCTIINEWVPKHLSSYEDEIIERMKKKIVRKKENEYDAKSKKTFRKLFGNSYKTSVEIIPDYDYTDVLVSCTLSKL